MNSSDSFFRRRPPGNYPELIWAELASFKGDALVWDAHCATLMLAVYVDSYVCCTDATKQISISVHYKLLILA